jgi:ribose transport system substrate-binding protein
MSRRALFRALFRAPLRALPFALLTLLVAACAPKPAEPPAPAAPKEAAKPATPVNKGTIGVSVLTMHNPFFKTMGDAMVAEAAKHGYEVTLLDGDNNAATQSAQVQDFIVKKVVAIVLNPCDSHSVGTAIAKANAAGIPVFTADIASLAPEGKVVCHVATDNYAGGKLAGQAMIELLGGKGKVAIIDHATVESGQQRTKGFKEVIAQAKGIQIVDILPSYGDEEKAFAATQDLLQKHADLDAIFAINDPTALGVVAALEKAGRQNKVKVIGFDGAPEAKQAIKDGKIAADVVQYPDKIGAIVVQRIAQHMNGEKVEAQELIPTGLYKKADAEADPALKQAK